MEQQQNIGHSETRPAAAMSPECKAVIEHQQILASQEEELSRCLAAKTATQQHAESLRKSLPDVAALDRQLDDLLAKLAIGQAGDEDVARQEEVVGAARAEVERIQPELERCERTIEALIRVADDHYENIITLKQEKAKLIRRFLLAEAQAECSRYVEAGNAAAAAYTRLLALDTMLIHRGLRPHHAHAPNMFLPRFNLDACNEQQGHWFMKDALFTVDDRFDLARRKENVAAEYQALQDLYGIEFDD